MLACKVSYIHNEYNVRIIVLNSLCNKYTDCNKDFYKNWEAFFAFCDAILDINNISLEKQYTMDEDILWKNLTWMNKISFGKKILCIFRIIYNFRIAIARIHFAICQVQRDNSNPGIFFINLANILIAHLSPNLGYPPKRYC